MTPILPGTASRLGLRKRPPLTETPRRLAYRRLVKTEWHCDGRNVRRVNLWIWRAFENGQSLEWCTTDDNQVVYSKPVGLGAVLVDQSGLELMGRYGF